MRNFIAFLGIASCCGCASVSHPARSLEDIRPAALAVVVPTITISWLNNNTGDDRVVTGLNTSYDLMNWETVYETNCNEVTNFFVMPRPSRNTFFRAFNRKIDDYLVE